MRTMLELNDKLLLGRKVAIKRANEVRLAWQMGQNGN